VVPTALHSTVLSITQLS